MTDERHERLARLRRRLAVRTRMGNLRSSVLAARVEPVDAVGQPPRGDVRLLTASPLFDHEWYSRLLGRDLTRAEAVQHYLSQGSAAGLTPHPLFDPETFRASRPVRVGEEEPLVYYLRERCYFAPTHPLFDTDGYLEKVPEAGEYPDGPVAHYVAVGMQSGVEPNDWLGTLPGTGQQKLLQWIDEQQRLWVEGQQELAHRWTAGHDRQREDAYLAEHLPAASVADHENASVSVVLLAREDEAALRRSVETVLAQHLPVTEVLVVGARTVAQVSPAVGDLDPRVQVVPEIAEEEIAALNIGLKVARGTYTAWMTEGDQWQPDRLRLLVGELERTGAALAHDVVEDVAAEADERFGAVVATRGRMGAGMRLELSAVVSRTSEDLAVGGFDEELPNAARHDHLLRLVRRSGAVPFVPVLGVRIDSAQRLASLTRRPGQRPWLQHAEVDGWHDVVLNRQVIDWDELRRRPLDDGLVSVVIPTYKDAAYTTKAVQAVRDDAAATGDDVEVIVVDNGCGPAASAALATLPHRFPGTRVVTNAVNHGFALGNNLGLVHARGALVVFLNNDTEAQPGWLAPLRAALNDPGTLAAQSLLLFPSGAIQSAGVTFPVGGGVPHELLAGFPVEDAEGLESESFNALTAAALAVRFQDVAALQGFDPVFRNGMEDVDFCLRLKQLRPGRLVVRTDSRVVHHESRSAGRFEFSATNRRIFLDRWADTMPADDVALWRGRGYEVVGHEIRGRTDRDRRVCQPLPVLAPVTRSPLIVDEPAPRLRWAIKNPAPSDSHGDRWGDTHFAAQLARALRGAGQEVVVDRRQEFYRESGRFDEVVLVLRGVAPYRPAWGQINLMWLISHPEMFARHEGVVFDRVLAASAPWAEDISRQWGIRVDPLLQATDPAVFHPDVASPDTGDRVLFVGSSRRVLRPMVRDAVAAGLPLSVYGPQWEGLIPDSYVKAGYLPNDQVGAAYRSAGVVLNDHWEDMRDEGFLSNRIFDAVASGARVITDDVAGLRAVFGRNVQVARDQAGLAELVNAPDLDAVFGDDAERREEAARIAREHSFDARARSLLDIALDIRRLSLDKSRT